MNIAKTLGTIGLGAILSLTPALAGTNTNKTKSTNTKPAAVKQADAASTQTTKKSSRKHHSKKKTRKSSGSKKASTKSTTTNSPS